MTDMKALSQSELLMAPALPVKKAARPKPRSKAWAAEHEAAVARGEAVTGYPDFAALIADQRRKAEAVQIDRATLAGWYVQQLEATEAHVSRLAEAMRRLAPALTSVTEGPWEKHWLLDARYRYAHWTLNLLRARSHCLVCPNHGIPGVQGLTEGDYEGLSLRGVLTGEGAGHWSRYCEKCQMGAGIQTMAHELRRQHEEMTR